jgi:hypothetical protein
MQRAAATARRRHRLAGPAHSEGDCRSIRGTSPYQVSGARCVGVLGAPKNRPKLRHGVIAQARFDGDFCVPARYRLNASACGHAVIYHYTVEKDQQVVRHQRKGDEDLLKCAPTILLVLVLAASQRARGVGGTIGALTRAFAVERVTRIELAWPAWKVAAGVPQAAGHARELPQLAGFHRA